MATIANDLRGILSLVLLMTISITSTNIDCNGKPFHCMNSTHFLICVDLGSGISITIDDFVIPCPPTTFCQRTNRFECEFPMMSTTVYPLEVIHANEGTTAENFATLKETKISDPSIDIADQAIIRNDLNGISEDDNSVSSTITFPNVTNSTVTSYPPTNDNSVKEATTTGVSIVETIKEVNENIQIQSSTHESIYVPNVYLDEHPFIENALVKPQTDIKLSDSDVVLENNNNLIKNGAHTHLFSLEVAEQSNVLHAADLENISGQALNSTIIINVQNITREFGEDTHFQDTSLSLHNLTDIKINVDEIVTSSTNNESLLTVDSSIIDIPTILNTTKFLPSDSIPMNNFDPLPIINDITLLNETIPSQYLPNAETHLISSLRQANNSLIDLKEVSSLRSDNHKSIAESTTVTEQNHNINLTIFINNLKSPHVSDSITDTNETSLLGTEENVPFKSQSNEELIEGLSPGTLSLKPTIPTESVIESPDTLAQNNKQRNISSVFIVADETIPFQNFSDISLPDDILSHSLNSRMKLNKTLHSFKTSDTFSLEPTTEPVIATIVHTFQIISNNQSSTNTDPLKRQYNISTYDRPKPDSILAIESSTVTEPNTLLNTTDATLPHNNEIQNNGTDSGIKETLNSNKSASRLNYTDNNLQLVNNYNLNDEISLFKSNYSLNLKSIPTSEPIILIDTDSFNSIKLSGNTNTYPTPNKTFVAEFTNITKPIKTVNTTLLPSNELQNNTEMLNIFNNTLLDLTNYSLQDKNNESGNTNSPIQLIEMSFSPVTNQKIRVESDIANRFPISITSAPLPDSSHSTNAKIITLLSNTSLPNNSSLSQYNKNESMKVDIILNNNYSIQLNQSLNIANRALPEFGTEGESVTIVNATENTHVFHKEHLGFTRLVENLTTVGANTHSIGFTDATDNKLTNDINISTIANKILHSNDGSLPKLIFEESSNITSDTVTVGSITTTERIKIVNTAHPNITNIHVIIPSNLNTNESVSLQNLNEEIDNIISENLSDNFSSLLNETILSITTENILNQRSAITNEQSANEAHKSENLEQTYTKLNNDFIDYQNNDFLRQSTENIPNNNFLSINKPRIREHTIINAKDSGLVHTNEVENTSIVLDRAQNNMLTNEKPAIQSSYVTTESSLNISPILAQPFTTPLIEINVNVLDKNTTASDDELSIYENNANINNIQNASYYVVTENSFNSISDINVGERQIVESLPVYVASPQSNIALQIQNDNSKTDSLRDTETTQSNVDETTEKKDFKTLANATLNNSVADSKHDKNILTQLYLADHKIYDSNGNNTLLTSANTQVSQSIVNSSTLFNNSVMVKVKLSIDIDPIVTTEDTKIKSNALSVGKYDQKIDNKIVVNVSATEEVPLVATNLSSIIHNATNFTSVRYPLLRVTPNIKPLTDNLSRSEEIRTNTIDINYNQEPTKTNINYNYAVVIDMNKKERIATEAASNESVVMNGTDAQRKTSLLIDMPLFTDLTGDSANISSLSNNISDKVVLTTAFSPMHNNITRKLSFESTEKTFINDEVGKNVLSTNSDLNMSFSREAVIQTTPVTLVVNAVPQILSEHTNIKQNPEEQRSLYFKENLLENSTTNAPSKIKPKNKDSWLNITYSDISNENKEIENSNNNNTRFSTTFKGDVVTVDVFNMSSKQVNSFTSNHSAGLQPTLKQMGSPVDKLTAANNTNYTSDKVYTTLANKSTLSNNNATEFTDYPQYNNDETKINNFTFYTGINVSVLVVTDKLDKEHDKILFILAPHINSNISNSTIDTSVGSKNNIQNETKNKNQFITTLTDINNTVDTVYPSMNSTVVNHTISTNNNVKNTTSIDDKQNRSITILNKNVIRSNKPYVSVLSQYNNTEYIEAVLETTTATDSPVNYNVITYTHTVINSSIFTTVQSLPNETIPSYPSKHENISKAADQIKSSGNSVTYNIDMINVKANKNSTLFKKTPDIFIRDNNQILRNATGNSTQTLLKNYDNKVKVLNNHIPKTNSSIRHIMNTIKYSVNFNCQNFNLGKYADNQDCTKFYLCIGGAQSVVGYCPINTVFSDFNKQCTSNLSHCVRNNQFRCSQEGRFSDLFVDNTYYICLKNKMNTFTRYKLKCQNGYHLNKTALKCELDEDVSRQSEESASEDSQKSKKSTESRSISKEIYFDCPREGHFSDSEDCRKYYACTRNNKSQYRRKIKFCGSDEVFHRDEQRCVDIDSYECWNG